MPFRLTFWSVQLAVAVGVAWSLLRGPLVPGASIGPPQRRVTATVVSVSRQKPLRPEPLYDDPEVVSDADLAKVLSKVLPRFAPEKRKPNFIEHALRTWGVDAKFREPGVMSGQEMKEFLTNHGKYLASWGSEVEPLLVEEDANGVAIRYGTEDGASVHHDHWLASLTEAGVSIDEPVFTPSPRLHTINDVLQQALRDLELDEREVEWSALAFAMWIAPTKSWKNGDGRLMSFDLMARRLMRGTRWGVCAGTHRVYSLMALVRLDEREQFLSPVVRGEVLEHLGKVRDQIQASQLADGSWPSNWAEGADAVKKPLDEPLYKRVIATGHHLEWLSIAPRELHPPREQILKAARWCVETIGKETNESAQNYYTFYSHVGAALAAWRETTPAEFYGRP